MNRLKNIFLRYLLCLFASILSSANFAAELTAFEQNILDANTIKQLESGYLPNIHVIESEVDTPLVTVIPLLNGVPAQRKASFNYGFSDKSYWLAFSLKNTTANSIRLFTEIDYSLLDNIHYYLIETISNTVLEESITGDRHVFEQRPLKHPNFVFPINIDSGQEVSIIFNISTTSSNQFPIRIWSQTGLNNNTQKNTIFTSGIFSIALIFGLYNLLLFLSLRDTNYLYLSLCSLGYSCLLATISGFSYFYFWPNIPLLNDISFILGSNISLVSFCLFTRNFLDLKQHNSLLNNVLLMLCLFGIALIIMTFFIPYKSMIQLTSINVILCFLASCIAGINLSITQQRRAKLFILSFIQLIIGASIFVLDKMGLINNTLFSENAMHMGVGISIVLFSFILADRINEEKKEKEDTQEKYIDSLKKYHSIYESSIEGIFRASANGDLLDSNPAFMKMLGIDDPHKPNQLPNNLVGLVPKYLKDKERLLNILSQHEQVIGFEALCQKLNGEIFWGSIHAKCAVNENTEHYVDASIIDITEKVKNAEQLNFIANHDILTGLSNRLNFEKKLARAIDASKTIDAEHALLFMDLDQFKIVNDTAGHSAGDELLKQVSVLFKKYVRINDSVARLGGDEFVILLNNINLEAAEEIANRLREEVSDYRFYWKEKVFSIGISIGIVPICKKHVPTENLMSLADTACYVAKDSGRNNVYVYKSPDDKDLPERQTDMALSSQLGEAIDNNSLLLYQQKILDFNKTENLDHYEVLVRMRSKGKVLLPGSFLTAAERFDHIVKLDLWVINAVLQHISSHPNCLEKLYQANINISGRTISSNRFEGQLLDLFDKYQIPKEKFCFEITESTAISNLTQTSEFLIRMQQQGFRFALDDFGSGFSSFSYLKLLPISSLKIDGSFVKNIATDPIDRAMVKSITDVAHMMDITVTAEFVENETILTILKEIGVDSVQGFHIHKPKLLV